MLQLFRFLDSTLQTIPLEVRKINHDANRNNAVNANDENITTHLTQTQTSKGLADKVYLLPVTPDYVEQVMLCILCFVHLGQFS